MVTVEQPKGENPGKESEQSARDNRDTRTNINSARQKRKRVYTRITDFESIGTLANLLGFEFIEANRAEVQRERAERGLPPFDFARSAKRREMEQV